jgi:predicted homoserine dehydrogenase-like protein
VWNGDAVATAKHDLRIGDILDGEGGHCVWAKAIPAKASSKINALPIGLAHNVKLKNPIKRDEIVKIDDVELVDVDDIISYRKNMETLLI